MASGHARERSVPSQRPGSESTLVHCTWVLDYWVKWIRKLVSIFEYIYHIVYDYSHNRKNFLLTFTVLQPHDAVIVRLTPVTTRDVDHVSVHRGVDTPGWVGSSAYRCVHDRCVSALGGEGVSLVTCERICGLSEWSATPTTQMLTWHQFKIYGCLKLSNCTWIRIRTGTRSIVFLLK